MDKKLHIIQHLYDEGDSAAVEEALRDAEERLEYDQLRDLKAQLDQRPRPVPDVAVIDRIVALADKTALTAPRTARADRPARSGKSRLRNWSAISLTLAVVIAVGIGIVQMPLSDGASQAPMSSELANTAPADVSRDIPEPIEAAPSAPAPARQRLAVPLAEEAIVAAGEQRVMTELEETESDMAFLDDADGAGLRPNEAMAGRALAAPVLADSEAVPAWEEGEALVELHRRIELLQARSADDRWDEPAVMSLDVLPTQPGTGSRIDRGLNTVGSGSQNNNNP